MARHLPILMKWGFKARFCKIGPNYSVSMQGLVHQGCEQRYEGAGESHGYDEEQRAPDHWSIHSENAIAAKATASMAAPPTITRHPRA